MGHRISWHYDANVDGSVNGSDPTYYFRYDERWRIVATYRGLDSPPDNWYHRINRCTASWCIASWCTASWCTASWRCNMAYGIARSTFIRALLLGVSTLLGVTASANGQCSAYTSVMAIASNNGGNATLVDVTLSDGGELVFNADTTLGVFAYVQQGPAIKDFSGWYEDANGTATMTNADGDICTIACGSNGVVHISIEGPTFDARSWYVNLSLASSMPGDTCGCSGTSTQTSQCKAEECRLTKKCSKNGYCQAGTLPVKMPAGEPQ